MSVRKFFLTIAGCSIPLGLLAGVAVDPTMLPRAVHPWQKHDHSPHTASASYEFVDSGPQDLSPWATDRTPTWKRGRAVHEVEFVPVDDGFDAPFREQPAETDRVVSAESASLADAAPPARSAAIDAQAPVITVQSAIERHAELETVALPTLDTE